MKMFWPKFLLDEMFNLIILNKSLNYKIIVGINSILFLNNSGWMSVLYNFHCDL